MITFRNFSTALAAIAVTLPSVLSAATPGQLTVEPPTLECAGFHWEITGDGGSDASATIEYRKAGEADWRKGMDFMRFTVDGVDFVSGSLFNLEPGTQYEARLTLVDPDGVDGEPTQTVTFTTRTEPTVPTGGRTFHVYPEDYTGTKDNLDLGKLGDWRVALADPEKSPLQPGDIVAMHGGNYQLEPNVDAVTVRSVDEVSTAAAPSPPTGGTTWHIYPLKYDGEKEEPLVKLNHYETPILRKGRDGEQVVKPGDTVLIHAGTYKVNKLNYRDKLFQGPKWGVWRHWGGGEPGNPVIFKAAGDGEVIFDGDGNMGIFEVSAGHHIWIDGLTFRNAQSAIIAGQDGLGLCEGLTVTNCKFENVAMPIFADTETPGWHLSGNTGLEGVHAGPWFEGFGTILVKVAGQEGRPIVIQPAGDGEVMVNGGDNYAVFDVNLADHFWIKDLKMRNTECCVLAGYSPFGQAPDGLIVTGVDAEDVRMGVYGDESTGENWFIVDNRFIGRAIDNMSMNQHVSPFGISTSGRGHVIAFNHLEWFQDGIDIGWWDRETSYQEDDYSASVDVCYNYVYGSGDNSLEADGSYFNGRFFENAFLYNNSPSTQSTPGGPYYFIRNIFTETRASGGEFKLPRAIIAHHNIFSTNHSSGGHGNYEGSRFLNNLFVFAPGKRRREEPAWMIQYKRQTAQTVSDYNGFRLVPEAMHEKPYAMGEQTFATLEEYAAATGLETHSILVPGFEELFVNVPELDSENPLRLEDVDFRLKDGVPAIDAGTIIPNINEDFNGSAPDLGPIEHGTPLPHYGPRNPSLSAGATVLD